MRRTIPLVVMATWIVWACGSNGTRTLPSPTSAKPQTSLSVNLTVTNSQWNTALPEDFIISITGGGFPLGVALTGALGDQRVAIEAGAPYNITVVGPEGYVETLSSGCTGTDPQSPVSCSITEKEAPFGCDPVLWDRVYRQDRLRVLTACETAVVTIASARLERDGDADILADPEPAFRRLLGPGNDSDAGGKLVVEIPCQGPVTQGDAMGTCNNFKGTRLSPPLAPGERVVAAAHWVEDKNHGMQRELHGARIRRLPR